MQLTPPSPLISDPTAKNKTALVGKAREESELRQAVPHCLTSYASRGRVGGLSFLCGVVTSLVVAKKKTCSASAQFLTQTNMAARSRPVSAYFLFVSTG